MQHGFIFFDLEWNNVSRKSFPACQNEIFEIGAIKCSYNLEIIDSIEMYLPMAKEVYEPFYHLLKHHIDKREEFWKNGKIGKCCIN